MTDEKLYQANSIQEEIKSVEAIEIRLRESDRVTVTKEEDEALFCQVVNTKLAALEKHKQELQKQFEEL